jgi:hypothetical protein
MTFDDVNSPDLTICLEAQNLAQVPRHIESGEDRLEASGGLPTARWCT